MQSTQNVAPLRHLPLLDGWRALSITLVLVGHLLPVGPSQWAFNAPTAATGMVMFFTLSGFLITRFLIEDGDIRRFLVRRLMRIVPLGWLGMFLAFLVAGDASLEKIAGNLLFYANLPPFFLVGPGSHFWSLCLEVQFYLSIAMLVAIGGKRALFAIPLACVAITCARLYWHEPMSIVSWFRADEILAGATLALIYEGWFGDRARKFVAHFNLFLLAPLLFASADLRTGFLPFLRPYISALMIGASLYNAPLWLRQICQWRAVVYTAQTSYALYVFHGIFANTWLGSGDALIKYAKRPLLFAATVAFAHLSTFRYERYWNIMAKRLTTQARNATDPGLVPR
ncbi:acyltransferase family protein [Sphingopyxis sp. Root154]|jgi:peptidoglycan/LPS O-acetylase OafA/YrhL|nr:acyltransferase [Sphingopyxis sp. Root154]